MRTRPPSELARMRAHFTAQGWNPDDLQAFKMQLDTGSDAGAGEADEGPGTDGSENGDEAGTVDLGDAGKRAIAAERDKARLARDELRPWKALGTELGLSPDEIRDAVAKLNRDGNTDASSVDVKRLEREAQAKADARANARIVRAEVKAVAADLFADPADAPLYIDVTKYDVDDHGDVDLDAIKADLEGVLVSKPHLAKGKKMPAPDPSQGSRGPGKKESQPGLGRMRDYYADAATTSK